MMSLSNFRSYSQFRTVANFNWTLPVLSVFCVMAIFSSQPARCQDPPASASFADVQSIEVYPKEIAVHDTDEQKQIVVSATNQSGQLFDVTLAATLTSSDENVFKLRGRSVVAVGNGTAQLTVQAGNAVATIPVTVSGAEVAWQVPFESGVLAALSKNGCNSGACHGSPSGKAGFRLSLRAFDPKVDQHTLIAEEFGRRINRLDAAKSLLITKPTMKTAHGGGLQLRPTDPAYKIMTKWIEQGAKLDPPNTPRCVKLETFPNSKRILRSPMDTQQLAVTGVFSDGSRRDLTQLSVYESSDVNVAVVSRNGLVKRAGNGEAAVLVRFLEHIESLPIAFLDPSEGFAWSDPGANNYVDENVNNKLRQMQINRSEVCTDSEFLRRVYLDSIGVLPSPEEARAFLDDVAVDKRSRKINELLERPEFAKFWALKWGDLFRLTTKSLGDEGTYKFFRWLENSVASNMPYDEFARELIEATGSTLTNPPANFFRSAPDRNDCVETISQVFLGARLQCAKCHNHPFERWTQDNYYAMGVFFERVQRKKTSRPNEVLIWESNSGNVVQPRTGQVMKPWLPGAANIELLPDSEVRKVFADWLTSPENPYFARIEVNRIWSQLFSRGIVDPIDDFRDSNPPCNPELLDALAADFAKSKYDRKHILRTILNSQAYQTTFRTNATNAGDTKYFSHHEPRLLSAEQLLDAIDHLAGIPRTYASLPVGTRATQIPAPDIVKLEFLKTFGQPERTSVCACERSDESTLGMAIEFFNGPVVRERIGNAENRFRKALAAGKSNEEILAELYLAAFSRSPTPEELAASIDYIGKQPDRSLAFEDVCWVILNSNEFLFQH
jgi:Protein of unknown function (DUF1553)/Protein of unknown function (DUF1549)